MDKSTHSHKVSPDHSASGKTHSTQNMDSKKESEQMDHSGAYKKLFLDASHFLRIHVYINVCDG